MSEIPIGPSSGPGQVDQAGGASPLDDAQATDAGAAIAQAPLASIAQTTLRAASGAFSAASIQSRLLDTLQDQPPAKATAPEGYASLDAAREGNYVRPGASGEPVAALQRALQAAGLNVGVSGQFDAATLAAVKKFQGENGCQVDGIVGPETLGALDHALGLQAPAPPPALGPAGAIPKTGNAFIDSIAEGAVQSMRETGVPASVTIAQAILESGYGQSGLSKNHFNFFGIKGTGPAGSANMPTKEFMNGQWVTINADFRAYHNAAESLTDHAKLLANGKPYKKAMADKGNPEQFAHDLTGVYATAPNYGDSLVKLMKQYDLTRFDAAAGGEPA